MINGVLCGKHLRHKRKCEQIRRNREGFSRKIQADAWRITVEFEMLSEMYICALQAGEPVLLTPGEFREAQKQFAGYAKPEQTYTTD
ncbi:MAG TPA: hypothetical protein VIM35_00780 [Gallionella sp.]